MTNISEKQPVIPDQINLLEIIHTLWVGRTMVLKTIAVFFVIGLIVIFGTPNEYKSEVTLLVESQTKNSGMSGLMQQFTGLSGMNLGMSNSEDELSPKLYPDVIKSTPFLLDIMNQNVTESKYDSTLTVAQYLERFTKPSVMHVLMGYTIGLPGKIMGLFHKRGGNEELTVKAHKAGALKLTHQQETTAAMLSGLINVKDETNTGTLIISAQVQDPLVAAQLTDSVVKTLTYYIIDYRTQKAKNDLSFISDRHAEAKTRYIQSQQALAGYSDRNKNVILASVRAEEQRLQSEYNLEFGIYNTLSQQLEQAKLKVQENTPVFKVINPAKVALEKFKPKTGLILVVMVFLGSFCGIGLLFIQQLIVLKK